MGENMNRKPRSTVIPNLIAALVLLLIANVVMAAVLISRAHKNLTEQISKRMLDIGNTAADLLDADFIERMELEDVGSEDYEKALHTLRIFEENVDLSYIYAVRRLGDGSFIFTIDPDPNDPAPFGYPLKWEPELVSAANGIPSIESQPHTDRWGTFFTAYTPIFDKDKNVVGIIGVDYDAGLYGSHLSKDITLICLITGFMMLIGATMAILIVRQNRRRYRVFDHELTALDEGVEQLRKSIMETSTMKLQERPQAVDNDLLKTLASGTVYNDGLHKRKADEFTDVSTRMQKMQDELRHYISYLENQTYVDGLTGVQNKLAYTKCLEEIEKEIKAGKAQFVVAFFDLNGLRDINTAHGYAVGDTLLYAAATILASVFQQKQVFHVAGDEFVVIVKGRTLMDMDTYFERVNDELDMINKLKRTPVPLSMSKGSAAFSAERDTSYRQVLTRAELNERANKKAYYASNPKTA